MEKVPEGWDVVCHVLEASEEKMVNELATETSELAEIKLEVSKELPRVLPREMSRELPRSRVGESEELSLRYATRHSTNTTEIGGERFTTASVHL